MIVEEVKTVKRTFELGDMFVFVKSVPGCCYSAGDYMILRGKARTGHYQISTPDTVSGICSSGLASEGWLNNLLDSEAIQYEGKLT